MEGGEEKAVVCPRLQKRSSLYDSGRLKSWRMQPLGGPINFGTPEERQAAASVSDLRTKTFTDGRLVQLCDKPQRQLFPVPSALPLMSARLSLAPSSGL